MFRPVLVQNQQQFLSTTQGKRRKQDVAATANDRVHQIREARLLVFSRLVTLDTVGAFDNQDVRVDRWNLGLDQVSVLFSGVVASVQNFEPSNVDEEHTSPEDVTSMVGREGDTRTRVDDLVSRDSSDRRKRHRHFERGEQRVC